MEIVITHDSRQAHLAEPGYVHVGTRSRALTVLGGGVSEETSARTAVTAVDGRFPAVWTMGDPAWSPPT